MRIGKGTENAMKDNEKTVPIEGVTDSRGQFETTVPPGNMTIKASADGYGLQIKRTVIKAGKKEVTVKLFPQRERQERRTLPPPLAVAPWAPLWEPQPALVIGLGGTGRHVLTHLKKNLLDAGAGRLTDTVRLILFDTSDYELLEGQEVAVSFAGVSLEPQDIVEIGEDLWPVVQTLEREQETEVELRGWFPSSYYKSNAAADELNLEHGTRQRRPPSRALLVRDIRKGLAPKGVNVVLLLDSALSMREAFPHGSETIAKLEAVKRSAAHFIDQLDLTIDRAAIICFDSEHRILHPLSQDGRSIKKVIGAVRAGSEKRAFQEALSQAHDVLVQDPDTSGTIVLFSDDQEVLQAALASAPALKQDGIHLIVIGLGNIDFDLLRRISKAGEKEQKFWYASSASDLAHATVRIARSLGEGSRVWRLLHGAARAAMDDVDGLRVILVGSLAGGFGSAILSDIAYLARQAGKAVGAKSTSIEAYLATDGVFSQVTHHLEKNAVNTFAALRELDRFQIAQGYPFRMIYRADAKDDPILAGAIDWRLLDEVYLYDSLPAILPSFSGQEANWYQPAATVFPAMADIITLWLDKAARSGGTLSQYRRAIQGDVTAEQAARGRAVMGGFGIYVYRLPMYDIFELLKVRWARHLLHRFLSDSAVSDTKAEQKLDPSEKDKLSEFVCLFLIGAAGYETPACPPAVQMTGFLAFEGMYDELKEQIKNTSFAHAFEEDARLFRSYLNGALLTLLNGVKDRQERPVGEPPSYVLSFLGGIEQALERAQKNLDGEYPAFKSLIEAYLRETRKARQEIEDQLELIAPATQNESVSRAGGVYGILETLEIDCYKRLEALKTVLPRHYLYSPQYLDKWYDTYFMDAVFLQEALSRLHWAEDEAGHITFALRSWDDHLLRTDKVSQQDFVLELLRLAGHAGRNMLKGETLDAILSETVLSPDRFDETMRSLEIGAQPMLRFDATKAANAKRRLELGVNAAVNTSKIMDRLRQGLSSEKDLERIEITDPYSMFLAQMIDVIPFEAITTLNFASQTYRRWYGLEMGVPADPHSEPQAVFRAETVALSFEQRLVPELRQTPRLFSPIIVSALDAEEASRLFALALAAGWAHCIGTQVRLFLNNAEVWTTGVPPGANLHPLTLGFVRFATQAIPDHLEALRLAISEADGDVINVWRGWTSPDWQKQEIVQELTASGPEGNDLASVIALVVRDELRRRMSTR